MHACSCTTKFPYFGSKKVAIRFITMFRFTATKGVTMADHRGHFVPPPLIAVYREVDCYYHHHRVGHRSHHHLVQRKGSFAATIFAVTWSRPLSQLRRPCHGIVAFFPRRTVALCIDRFEQGNRILTVTGRTKNFPYFSRIQRSHSLLLCCSISNRCCLGRGDGRSIDRSKEARFGIR